MKTHLIIVLFACVLALAVAMGALGEEMPEVSDATLGEDGWWNILLLGGDSRDLSQYGRTDTMIILSINGAQGEAKLISVMRDTWVEYPGRSGAGKINAANVYGGPELAVETVEQSFGVHIDNYVLINMGGMVDIIDMFGGIDLDVTESELVYTNMYAQDYLNTIGDYQGETRLAQSGEGVHLNGLLAMSYCRNRYSDSDFGRVARNRKVLMALLTKMKTCSPSQLAAAAVTMLKYVSTDLSPNAVFSLAAIGAQMDAACVEQASVPFDGTFDSGMKNETWAIWPDFEENQELLHDFIYGADDE